MNSQGRLSVAPSNFYEIQNVHSLPAANIWDEETVKESAQTTLADNQNYIRQQDRCLFREYSLEEGPSVNQIVPEQKCIPQTSGVMYTFPQNYSMCTSQTGYEQSEVYSLQQTPTVNMYDVGQTGQYIYGTTDPTLQGNVLYTYVVVKFKCHLILKILLNKIKY